MLAIPSVEGATLAYSWLDISSGGNRFLYEIVLETGQATVVHHVPGQYIEGAAILPDGRMVGVDSQNDEYWQMMPTPTLLGQPSLTGVDAGMEYDVTSDTLYALTGGTFSHFESAYLYELDPDTGAPELIGYDLSHYADSLAISPAGQAYAADRVFDHRLYKVDLTSGQLVPGPPIRTPTGDLILGGGGLAFSEDSTLWMLDANDGTIFELDPSSGVATYVSTISVHRSGFNWRCLAIPIPEPSAFALFALGALTLRRRTLNL
jgi:outer membrane protein assembly factor BamB